MISGALAKSHDISDGAGPVVAVAVCLHGRGKAAPAGDLARCSHAEGGVYASASCQRPLRDHVALDLTLWRFKNYALRSGRGLGSSLTVSILAGCSLVRGIRRSSFVVKAAGGACGRREACGLAELEKTMYTIRVVRSTPALCHYCWRNSPSHSPSALQCILHTHRTRTCRQTATTA